MIDEEAWPFRGGHEVMAHLFLKAAVARGHEVRVVTGSPGPDKIDGIEYVRLDHPSRDAKEADADLRVSLIPKMKPLIDEYRPDAVFAGGFWVQEVVKGAKRAKVPVAFLKHNAWAEPPNADLVIYDSRFVKDSVKYHGRGVVLHPPAQWTPREPRSEGRGCYTMLNLCFTKGVHLFHALAKALPDRRFIGVEGGHGKQERYPKPNIKYAKKGEYPIETILDKWTGALLLPSKYESFGLIGLEAQCFGIPVIASDLPGIREALGSGAIYCEPWSVPAWIEAIHKLDDPAEYRRLSELAIRNAKEKEAEQPAEGFARAMEEMVRVHQKARAPVPQPARHLSRRERRMQVRA